VVIIPGDQPEEGICGCGGKDFEKRKVLRRKWKRHEKRQQAVQDQSMMMEKSWVMTTMQQIPFNIGATG